MHEGVQFAIFLLAVSVSVSTTEEYSTDITIQEYSVDIGDNVTLKCFLKDNNNNRTFPITWVKYLNSTYSAENSSDSEDKQYKVVGNFTYQSSFLHINNVSQSDAGVYECQQGTEESTTVSSRALLLVRFAPIIYDVGSHEVVATVGEDIQLFCNATGHPLPNITWRRISRADPKLDDILFTGKRLNISHIKKEDVGIYSCEASNGVDERARWDVLLQVKFSPEITTPTPEVRQAVNYSTQLECIVKAFPLPEIKWFKDEQEIVNDTQHVITMITSPDDQVTHSTRLIFPIVHRTSFGNYTCHAANSVGQSVAAMTLSESPFPVLPLIKETHENSKSTSPTFYGFNVTGFILGMMPPLWISFYIILHLGFRSRYAEERPEEEGGDGLDEIVWEQGLHFSTKF